MNRKIVDAFWLFLALIAHGSSWAQTTTYTPIPAGFDFPAKSEVLLGAMKANDQAALRRHGWMVFAGLTQPARKDDSTSEAIWETWFPGSEVFKIGPPLEGVRVVDRTFVAPRQFQRPKELMLEGVGASVLSQTLFNKELMDHTRTNKLQMASTLDKINSSWKKDTPVQDRKIPDYKPEAMSLKLVWMLVKKQGFSAIPVWDEQPRVAMAPEQPEQTWKRVVAVDPNRTVIPAGEKRDVTNLLGKTAKDAIVVPLTSFYHFKLDATQAARAGAVLQGVGKPEAGDYAALVAMHYTTKEIPNWVWATFWWHDKPDTGRFAAGRPADTMLQGAWRNFLMDVAYDMDAPREADGTPLAAFNPYLEARFRNGVNSNCMTCHQRAVWKKEDPTPDFRPVTRGSAKLDDPLFVDGTTVDFLWSLLYEGNKE